MLKNNFKIKQTHDGQEYLFLYLAQHGRFQVYLGGYNEQAAWKDDLEILDEIRVQFSSRSEAEPYIEQFLASGAEEF